MKFGQHEAHSKLEEESYFYWAVGERWLCDNFYKWHRENLRGAMTVTHGKKSGTLYMTIDSCGFIVVTESKEDPKLCHQRLGHMSCKGLEIMHLNEKLSGLKFVDIDMC